MANLDDDKLDKGLGDDEVKGSSAALEEGEEDAEGLDSWELEEEDLDE